MSRVAYTKRNDRKGWKKTHSTGGVCFSVSYDKLEALLRKDLGKGFTSIKGNEYVDRFEVDEKGITVFIENINDRNLSVEVVVTK